MGHAQIDTSAGVVLPWPSTMEEVAEDTRCPVWVDHPVMVQRWRQLTFLDWPFDPDTIQRHLPTGLSVDTFAGQALIGLIPFHLQVFSGRARVGTAFPGVNVRTYVIGP